SGEPFGVAGRVAAQHRDECHNSGADRRERLALDGYLGFAHALEHRFHVGVGSVAGRGAVGEADAGRASSPAAGSAGFDPICSSISWIQSLARLSNNIGSSTPLSMYR